MAENSYPRSEQEKANFRASLSEYHDQAIDGYQVVFRDAIAPYYDAKGRYLKAYDLWTPQDFMIMGRDANNRIALKVLHNMAEIDDWGHLNQILPTYYRNHGGVRAFARDIEKGWYQNGVGYQGRYLNSNLEVVSPESNSPILAQNQVPSQPQQTAVEPVKRLLPMSATPSAPETRDPVIAAAGLHSVKLADLKPETIDVQAALAQLRQVTSMAKVA